MSPGAGPVLSKRIAEHGVQYALHRTSKLAFCLKTVILGIAEHDGFKGTESIKLYLSAVLLTDPSDISDNNGRRPEPIAR